MLTRRSSSSQGPRGRHHVAVDVVLILALSLVTEAARFSPKQGRAVISGDSAQHVDGAEALLSNDATPNFAFRKPGYTLILAGLGALTGNMSWSAIVANHWFLGMLPLAAYGLGYNLRGRRTGWIAAVLTIAQLQTALWGDRIMSEASFTFFLTFGILFLATGLSIAHKSGLWGPEGRSDSAGVGDDGMAGRNAYSPSEKRPRGARRVWVWLLGAGLFLACAWFIRAIGIAVIAAAVVCTAGFLRRAPRAALGGCALLVAPVMCAAATESTLNLRNNGRFKLSTGGLGIMLQTRARHFQGSPFPDTETTRWFLSLLPERRSEDAYLVNELDGCIARQRAINEQGMDEWSFNSMAAKSGLETIASDPVSYVRSGALIFVRHLLRQTGGPPLSPVTPDRRKPVVVHRAAPDFQTSQDYWYAFWFLPHRSVGESTALVEGMRTAAQQRAPFGRDGIWRSIRYYGAHPVAYDVLGALRAVGSVWPGFALILCGLLRLNWRTCTLLAVAYVLEAAIIAACGASDIANERYQFVWVGTDSALVACLVAAGVDALRAASAELRGSRGACVSPAGAHISRRSSTEPITT